MEYTIKKLAEIAKVSTRTLRYYDEINLLKPKRINSSGYRIYGEDEVNLLQEIMIYKTMEISLSDIEKIISDKNYNTSDVLNNHLKNLILKRKELDEIIDTVDKTIKNRNGELEMNDKDKFKDFKKEKIEENEKLYGKEIRKKYGDEDIDKSNEKFNNLSEEDFNKMKETEEIIFNSLKKVLVDNNYYSDSAKQLYKAHREWLMFSWNKYTKEDHYGLAQCYKADERFIRYYDDRAGEGATEVLVKVIEIFIK